MRLFSIVSRYFYVLARFASSITLDMIRRTIINKEPRIMMSLYKTAGLVRSHMWSIVQAHGAHSTKKDKELIEKIQHRLLR